VLAQPAIPYNLDAWDGYPVARETVLGTAASLNKNLVVLAGDTHNAWASDLRLLGGHAGRRRVRHLLGQLAGLRGVS
jgi:alkaline phosphatase D